MSVRGPASVIGISFLLLTGLFVLGSLHAQDSAQPSSGPSAAPPLAGTNSVSGLQITQAKSGVWMADFDYFYTGEPPFASLAVELTPQPGAPLGPNVSRSWPPSGAMARRRRR